LARVTVEDCLEKEPNRFALVVLGSMRARQLQKGYEPLVKCTNKPAVTALREIAQDKVRFHENVPIKLNDFIRASGLHAQDL
jgi:DNA-directed RNA polymerase subunit omega